MVAANTLLACTVPPGSGAGYAWTLTINGHSRTLDELSEPAPLSGVILTLDLKADRIAVEHNGEIAPRTTWPNVKVHNQDRLEIVHFVGGGSTPP